MFLPDRIPRAAGAWPPRAIHKAKENKQSRRFPMGHFRLSYDHHFRYAGRRWQADQETRNPTSITASVSDPQNSPFGGPKSWMRVSNSVVYDPIGIGPVPKESTRQVRPSLKISRRSVESFLSYGGSEVCPLNEIGQFSNMGPSVCKPFQARSGRTARNSVKMHMEYLYETGVDKSIGDVENSLRRFLSP